MYFFPGGLISGGGGGGGGEGVLISGILRYGRKNSLFLNKN